MYWNVLEIPRLTILHMIYKHNEVITIKVKQSDIKCSLLILLKGSVDPLGFDVPGTCIYAYKTDWGDSVLPFT